MAYVTGSAADMAAVKTALVDACTSNGWTSQTDADGKTVLSNGGCYVRVEAFLDHLDLLGRTSLDSGNAPTITSIGNATSDNYPNITIGFPVTYFAFIYLSEVYFVINYSDCYQWCAFGQSNQSGLSGTGNWVSATFGNNRSFVYGGFSIGPSGNSGGGERGSAALFWDTELDNPNGWIHNNIETSYPWAQSLGGNIGGSAVGIKYLTELVKAQPNQFSGEGILLPIRAYKSRPDSKVSQLIELEYARHIRIDNYIPEQIITLGTDEWMLFPWYAKDASNRDGSYPYTGTFGWAIKKA